MMGIVNPVERSVRSDHSERGIALASELHSPWFSYAQI
jgi:hypothetical protein